MAGEKANQEEQLEELKYIQQVYQNQYNVANNSINMMLQELQELNAAQKTLENTQMLKGKETITSIGANFYSFSKIQNPDTFLVAVGANYLIEKDVDSSKEYIAKMIQNRNENLNRLMKSKKEVEAALIEISYKIDSMR